MAALMTRKEADSLIERTYVEFNDLINNSGIQRTTMDNGHKTFLGYTDALFQYFDNGEYKEAVAALDMASYTQYFGKFAELSSLLHLPTEKAFKNAELLDSAHLAEVLETTESAEKLAEEISGFSVKELSVLPYNDKLYTVDKMLEAWTMFSGRERQFIKLTDSFTDDELPAFLAYISEDRNSRLRQIFKKVNGKERIQLLAFFNTVLMQKGLADSRGKEISIPSGYTVSAQFTAAGISLAWYKTDANGTVIDQKDADVSPFSLILYPYKKETVEVPALTFLSNDGQEDFLFENKYGETLNFAELSQAQKDALFWEFTRHYLPGSFIKTLLGNPVQTLVMILLGIVAVYTLPETAAVAISAAAGTAGTAFSFIDIVYSIKTIQTANNERLNATNVKELRTAASDMADTIARLSADVVSVILAFWDIYKTHKAEIDAAVQKAAGRSPRNNERLKSLPEEKIHAIKNPELQERFLEKAGKITDDVDLPELMEHIAPQKMEDFAERISVLPDETLKDLAKLEESVPELLDITITKTDGLNYYKYVKVNPEQKKIAGSIKNPEAELLNEKHPHDFTKKGNYGEIKSDVNIEDTGRYRRISDDRVTSLDDPMHHGIDGIYKNANPPPDFIIIDSKYLGSDAATAADFAPKMNKTANGTITQMENKWILDNLDEAISDDIMREKIVNALKSNNTTNIAGKVDKNGIITYYVLNEDGKVIKDSTTHKPLTWKP